MEGRALEITNYRFGFQGQEKINEISGTGNHINFTYRGYDIRRGQFWSIDPLARKYPNNSPYTFVCNNPIMNIEEDGRYFISFSKRQGNNYIIHVTNQYYKSILG
jgi:RHS repeat-associated protein